MLVVAVAVEGIQMVFEVFAVAADQIVEFAVAAVAVVAVEAKQGAAELWSWVLLVFVAVHYMNE